MPDSLSPEVRRDLQAIDDALAGRPVEPALSELGRLALALREERPAADPVFTRDLDRRAAEGFPPRRRRRGIRGLVALAASPGRRLMVAGVAASALLAVVVAFSVLGSSGVVTYEGATGGTAARDSDGSGGGAVADESMDQLGVPSAPQKSGEVTSAAGGGEDAASVAPPAPPTTGGGGSPRSDRRSKRLVERSASLTLVAPPREINSVADRIVGVADRVGGFVVSSSVNATDGMGGGGDFTLRVPSDRLQEAIAQLSRIAHVRERRDSQQDITALGVSARSRLQDARAERKSLLGRLEAADTDDEAEALKAQLRAVNRRISLAKGDLARVNNRASFSNVAVALVSDPAASEDGDDDGVWSPGDAARDALRVLEVLAGVVLVALAILIPLTLIGVLVWLGVRASIRRGRERALDAV